MTIEEKAKKARAEYMKQYRARKKAEDPEGYKKKQREYQEVYWTKKGLS